MKRAYSPAKWAQEVVKLLEHGAHGGFAEGKRALGAYVSVPQYCTHNYKRFQLTARLKVCTNAGTAATRSAALRWDSGGRRGWRAGCRRPARPGRRRRTPPRSRPARSESGYRRRAGRSSGIATPTRIPISPPERLTIIASVRNCSRISRARRPDRQPDADLARPLGHGHQHDVHDPDAGDDQRDRRDQHQHQPRESARCSWRRSGSRSGYRPGSWRPGRCRAARISCTRAATRSTSCGERTCTYSGSMRSTGVK